MNQLIHQSRNEFGFDTRYLSPLFAVKGYGLNTEKCESLTSILNRIARSHSIGPRDVVSKIMGGFYPEVKALCYASFFRSHSSTVNGSGKYAELFSRVLKELSTVNTLDAHTLRWTRGIFSVQGSPLISKSQRWCPKCFAEMLESRSEPYLHLYWSIAAAKFCIFHWGNLKCHCPHCGATQPIIPSWPDISYCDFCRKSLVFENDTELVKNVDLSNFEDEWYSIAAANLVKVSNSITAEQARTCLLTFLNILVDAIGDGNRAEFCRKIGLQERCINKWLAGDEKPTLSSFFRILYAFDLMPSDIFSNGDSISSDVIEVKRLIRTNANLRDKNPKTEYTDFLMAVLEEEKPPSLKSIAGMVGLTRSGLKYRYPKLCKQIVLKRLALRDKNTIKRIKSQQRIIRMAVHTLVNRGINPGRKRVDTEVRILGLSLASDHLRLAYQQALAELLHT